MGFQTPNGAIVHWAHIMAPVSVPEPAPNRLAQTWFVACLALTAFAMLCPAHFPSMNGRPAGWYFLWEPAPFEATLGLRVVLPIGLLLCAAVAWWSRNNGIRACALIPLTFLSAMRVLINAIQISEHFQSEFMSVFDVVVDASASWLLVLSTGLIAAAAFRLRRGLHAGRPYRWMVVASLIGMAAMGLTIRHTTPTHIRFDTWCYLAGGGAYLLLGLVTGFKQLDSGRRAITFLSRLTIGSVIWVFAVDSYFQHTQDFASVVRGLQHGAFVAIQYLAAAMLAVLCFEMRFGTTATALADETVFD